MLAKLKLARTFFHFKLFPTMISVITRVPHSLTSEINLETAAINEPKFFSEDVATFGDRLEAARHAKGLTVESLAAKLGVKTKTVINWENDAASPRANKLSMLAGLLNISIVWLISGKGNGSTDVAESFDRPEGINDAIGEIKAVKQSLLRAVERIERLEDRLLETS